MRAHQMKKLYKWCSEMYTVFTVFSVLLSQTEDHNLSQWYERACVNSWRSRLTYQLPFTLRQIVRLSKLIKMLNEVYTSTATTYRMTEQDDFLWLSSVITTVFSQWHLSLSSISTKAFTHAWASALTSLSTSSHMNDYSQQRQKT